MRVTVADVAKELGVSQEAANGLMLYLRETELAAFRGERPSPTGRGKGSRVYEVVDGASKTVAAAVRKLER